MKWKLLSILNVYSLHLLSTVYQMYTPYTYCPLFWCLLTLLIIKYDVFTVQFVCSCDELLTWLFSCTCISRSEHTIMSIMNIARHAGGCGQSGARPTPYLFVSYVSKSMVRDKLCSRFTICSLFSARYNPSLSGTM